MPFKKIQSFAIVLFALMQVWNPNSLLFAQSQFSERNIILESDFVSPEILGQIDVNEDSWMDLLMISNEDSRLGWYPGSENGFLDPEYLDLFDRNTGIDSDDIELVDLNSDNRKDIVLVWNQERKLVWFENLGAGQFSAEQIIDSTLLFYDNLVIHNRDEYNDVYVSSRDSLFRFENDGQGVFLQNAPSEFEVFDYTEFILVNHDWAGVPYFVEVGYSFIKIRSLTTGDQIAYYDFYEEYSLGSPLVLKSPNSNREELIVPFRHHWRNETKGAGYLYFRDNGSGQLEIEQKIFCNALWEPQALDFNDDGNLDLIIGSETPEGDLAFDLVYNNGQGEFIHPELDLASNENSAYFFEHVYAFRPSTDEAQKIVLVEFDGLSAFQKLGFSTFQFEEGLGFYYPSPYTRLLEDVDGNGLLDLLLSARYGSAGSMFLSQDSLLNFYSTEFPSSVPTSIIHKEEHDDGSFSLYSTNNCDGISMGRVEGNWEDVDWSCILAPEHSFGYAKLSDFDQDGDLDVVYFSDSDDALDWPDESDLQMRFLENKENASFEEYTPLEKEDLPLTYFGSYGFVRLIPIIQDLNQDGLDDIIVVGNGLFVYQNIGDLNFELKISESISLGGGRLVLEDLNNDGLLDLVIFYKGNSDSISQSGQVGRISVAYNLGDFQFTELQRLNPESNHTRLQVVHDFDNDGLKDILVNIGDASAFHLFKQLPNKEFELQFHTIGEGRSLIYPNIKDFDGDGFLDLVTRTSLFRYFSNYELSHWDEIKYTKLTDERIEIVDIDNDGDDDILSASDIVACYLNANQRPKVDFKYEHCGVLHLLNYSQTYFPNSEITWDFGDGHTSNKIQPSEHIYDELGTYDLSLTICNDYGCDTKVETIEIVQRYNAAVTLPAIAAVGQPVLFELDQDGYTNFTWLFGDGELTLEESPSHIYTEPGEYEVEVIMTENTTVGCTERFFHTILIVPDSRMHIYPNPANDQLNVFIPEMPLSASLSIRSLDGKVIRFIENLEAISELSISDLHSGIYLVELNGENGLIEVSKLIVE